MKTLREYLSHYLNELRLRPRSISFDEVRMLVDSAPLRDVRIQQQSVRWRNIMISTVVIIGAAIGITTLIPPDRMERRNRSLPVGASRYDAKAAERPSSEGRPIRAVRPTAAGREKALGSHVRSSADASIYANDIRSGIAEAAPERIVPAGEDLRNSLANDLPAYDRPRSDVPRSLPEREDAQSPADPSSDIDISGVRLIELPADALARLGIRADTAGVWVRSLSHKLPIQISMYGTAVHTKPEMLAALDLPAGPEQVALITDDLGNYRLFTSDSNDISAELRRRLAAAPKNSEEWQELSRKAGAEMEAGMHRSLGTLIPILVRTGHAYTEADRAAKRWRPDCIVWFRPAPEVLERLPAETRERIAGELAEVERCQERGSNVSRSPRGKVGERPYLDILRASSGAILSTTLRADPTQTYPELRLVLQEPRMTNISIVDISGRRLKRIESFMPRNAGVHEMSIDISGLAPGIYLVIVMTERGEQGVQRLIVQGC